jgi:Rieske Fe-S protein
MLRGRAARYMHCMPARMTETRRAFCAQACRAVALAAVGGSLSGCGGVTGPSAPTLPNLDGTVSGGAVSVTVGSSSPLAAVGSAALVNTSAGSFLVARIAQDSFTALTATCTHFGCTISGYESQTFVCPCHGSRFDTSGAVQRGPANRPLRSYATRFADDVLTITL